MTILELLETCKTHDITVEMNFWDLMDTYRIKFTKGDKHVVKCIPEYKLQSYKLDKDDIFDYMLMDLMEGLGVKIDG